jgi:cysteine desulfurase
MIPQQIYLDSNATTCTDPEVIKIHQIALNECYGNPSSIHYFGQISHAALALSRRKIASFFGVKPHEIIFFSSATEALSTLIFSLIKSDYSQIVSSDLEHAAVFGGLKSLRDDQANVTFISPKEQGAVSLEDIKGAVTSKTQVIILMAANNETGVITPIEEIAAFAKERGILFVVDGVALLGKEPCLFYPGISAMCFSAHKFHGPKGVGFAVVRKDFPFCSMIQGGGQEYGRRAGTENIPGIISTTKAIELVAGKSPEVYEIIRGFRDSFERQLQDNLEGVLINGKGPRVSNTSNLSFEGIDGEALLMTLDLQGVCASHGSACSSGALEPSRILMKMGFDSKRAKSSLRFSFSRMNTQEDVDNSVEIITEAVNRLRSMVEC